MAAALEHREHVAGLQRRADPAAHGLRAIRDDNPHFEVDATMAATIGVVRLPGRPPTECLSKTGVRFHEM